MPVPLFESIAPLRKCAEICRTLCTDPELIQIELYRRKRANQDLGLITAIAATISGIAVALRNSG